MKISLFVMVKNAAKGLESALSSVHKHVDEIVVVETDSDDGGETKRVAEKYTDKVFNYPLKAGWDHVDDFAAVRNFAMAKCTGDYVVWIDSDDVAVGFGKLRNLIQTTMEEGDPDRADCMFLRYDYSFDEFGNCITTQFRERVLRRGMYEWQGRVHEVAVPKARHRALKMRGDAPYIRHEGCVVGDAKDKARVKRNMRILEDIEAVDGLSDKQVLYKGNTLYALGRFDEACECFDSYTEYAAFGPEVYISRITSACARRDSGDNDSALMYLQTAIFENPEQPAAYTTAAEIFMRQEEWERSYHFAKMATEKTADTSQYAFNPMTKLAIPASLLQICCVHLNKYEEAHEWGKKASMFMRGDKGVQALLKQTTQMMEDKSLYEGYMAVKGAIESDCDSKDSKLASLLSAIPNRIADVGELSANMRAARSKDAKTMAIYCGPAVGGQEWGPRSVYTGIGGSEEAVINMAYEFRDLGWSVEVYGNPPIDQQGDFSGVQWLPYWAWRDEEGLDVFIGWRGPDMPKLAPLARSRYLWNHDKQFIAYSKEQLDRIDKMFVLSEYHRADPGLVSVPDDKIYVTSNGINENFLADGNEPDWFRCVYASNADRGLDLMLELWPRVREKVPEAEIDIYYGFTKWYDELSKSNLKMKELKRKVLSLVDQPGVNFHGMVGHDRLAEGFAKAAVWAYPTEFPEISCITAMKALAMGCEAVTSGYGVLPETMEGERDFGPVDKKAFITESEERQQAFVDAIAERLLKAKDHPGIVNELRASQSKRIREKYPWKKVAQDWENLFSQKLSGKGRSQKTLQMSSAGK